MGSLVILYKHPEAARIVADLNERNRRWWGNDVQGYEQMGKALDIQQDTKMPRGVDEIDFESKKYPGLYPTLKKVHSLGAFLETYGLTPLNMIFGYSSWEPDDWYSIPDWVKTLELIRSTIQSFPSTTKEPVDEVRDFRQHLEAFEEMILWINGQPDRQSFFLGWSA